MLLDEIGSLCSGKYFCTNRMFVLQPPVGTLRYMMNGEIGEWNNWDHSVKYLIKLTLSIKNWPFFLLCIVSAQGFEYDNLYIHFIMDLPNSESLICIFVLFHVTDLSVCCINLHDIYLRLV